MTRKPRVKSESKFYHVMFKGVNGRDLFLDDEDRKSWIRMMWIYFAPNDPFEKEILMDYNMEVHGYCLMSNHVHLLVRDWDDALDRGAKKLCVCYSQYFNDKYDRIGPVFNGRFRSEPVEDDTYYLTVLRYIHQNPVKAGICEVDDYEWSSYWDFVSEKKALIHIEFALELVGGIEGFRDFMTSFDGSECLEDKGRRPSDDAAARMICKFAKINDPKEVSAMPQELQFNIIKWCRDERMTKTQILKLTNVKRTVLNRK